MAVMFESAAELVQKLGNIPLGRNQIKSPTLPMCRSPRMVPHALTASARITKILNKPALECGVFRRFGFF